MSPAQDNRRESRRPRLVHVHWLNRESEGGQAELYDVSSAGMFLVPTGDLPDSVGKNDNVWIVVQQPEGERTLTGKVRWRGYSQEHDAIGFGVLLDRDSQGAAIAIFGLSSDPVGHAR